MTKPTAIGRRRRGPSCVCWRERLLMNQIEGQLESEAVVKVDFGTADEKHRGDCLRNWLIEGSQQ